jgi:F-type H+-transporting ATPase subunit b
MQIDWITVSAQIVNFLLLIWLLKRFLYAPVIRAMERREQHIAERLNEAGEREQIAEQAAEEYRERSAALERERDESMAEARRAAEAQKKEMLDDARASVAEARSSWQRQAQQEKQEFLDSLSRRVSESIQAIARKALSDLADAELEEQIVRTFIERLKHLDNSTRRAMAETADGVRIASTFELDSTVRGRLTRAIHECVADGLDVRYEPAPELLCGIEITSGGRRLSWNLARYLDELGVRVEEILVPTEAAATEAD